MSALTQHEDVRETRALLRGIGVRPTRQRVALARLLSDGPDRHFTAAELHEEACRAGEGMSLATVYNTLGVFTGAGLLREVVVEAGRSFYDTNTADHQHFFHEGTGRLEDIPAAEIELARFPRTPPGTRLRRVDVVVRVAPSGGPD